MSRSIRHGSLWPAQAGDSGVFPARALYDLRYSNAEVARAETEGRRARPQRVRPATENPCAHGRCGDFALINRAYATAQGSVRAAERAGLGELRKLLNGGAGASAAEEVEFGERANGRRAAW